MAYADFRLLETSKQRKKGVLTFPSLGGTIYWSHYVQPLFDMHNMLPLNFMYLLIWMFLIWAFSCTCAWEWRV